MSSRKQKACIETDRQLIAFEQKNGHSDESHDRDYVKCLQSVLAGVDQPLALVSIDETTQLASLVCLTGGSTRLLRPAPEQKAEHYDKFLKVCVQLSSYSNEPSQWQDCNGAIHRLHAVPMPGMLLINFHCMDGSKPLPGRMAEVAAEKGLTPAEIKVVELMAQGLGNKEIAREVNKSVHTVRAHLRSIYKRLDVSNRVEAVAVLHKR